MRGDLLWVRVRVSMPTLGGPCRPILFLFHPVSVSVLGCIAQHSPIYFGPYCPSHCQLGVRSGCLTPSTPECCLHTPDMQCCTDPCMLCLAGQALRLTPREESDLSPAISPDGQWLAVASGSGQVLLTCCAQIVARLASNPACVLANSPLWPAVMPGRSHLFCTGRNSYTPPTPVLPRNSQWHAVASGSGQVTLTRRAHSTTSVPAFLQPKYSILQRIQSERAYSKCAHKPGRPVRRSRQLHDSAWQPACSPCSC